MQKITCIYYENRVQIQKANDFKLQDMVIHAGQWAGSGELNQAELAFRNLLW